MYLRYKKLRERKTCLSLPCEDWSPTKFRTAFWSCACTRLLSGILHPNFSWPDFPPNSPLHLSRPLCSEFKLLTPWSRSGSRCKQGRLGSHLLCFCFQGSQSCTVLSFHFWKQSFHVFCSSISFFYGRRASLVAFTVTWTDVKALNSFKIKHKPDNKVQNTYIF